MMNNYLRGGSVVGSGLLFCCSILAAVQGPVYHLDNPLKNKEVIIPVEQDPAFEWSPKAATVELGRISSTLGSQLLSIGDGMAAGYRDGGLFRAGQLTSYPNLVAKQMGLSNFGQALFGKEHGNGTGRIQVEHTSAGISWNTALNNIAYNDDRSDLVDPVTDGLINNIATPGFMPDIYNSNPGDLLSNEKQYLNRSSRAAAEADVNYLWLNSLLPLAQFNRFLPSGSGTVWNYIQKGKPSLALINIGTDAFVRSYLQGGGQGLLGGRSPMWETDMLDRLKKMNVKQIYATLPDVLDFPYFRMYDYDKLLRSTGVAPTMQYEGGATVELNPGTIFLPTKNVVNMFRGAGRPFLEDHDVIREEEIVRTDWYNQVLIRKWSKEYGFAIVDFHAVFKKVLAGSYVSEDGFKIDPVYPQGNFFSADGLYPSAIGQAVLANEVIKVLNSTYDSKIPLINLSVYSKQITTK